MNLKETTMIAITFSIGCKMLIYPTGLAHWCELLIKSWYVGGSY